MSTERQTPAATRAAFREAAALRGFRRGWLATTVVLVLLAVGLGAAGGAQGPRLSSASLDTEATITRSGVRLAVEANQPVRPVTAAEVRVTPAAPVEVSSDGTRITVRFTGLLRYASDYTVELDVVGAATGASGVIRYEFTTPDVTLHTLVRGDDGDRIVRADLSGTTQETVFTAPRIQEYAVLGSLLAVVTLDDENTATLSLVDPEQGVVAPITTPVGSGIRALRASARADIIGFLLDATLPDGSVLTTLAIYDPAGSPLPTTVTDQGGAELAVRDWAFVPGTGSLVAQGADEQLFLVDPLTGSAPTALGQHAELRGFLPGTTTLVVADPTSGSLLDLAAGTQSTLALPLPEVDSRLSPGTLLLLDATSYLELYANRFGEAVITARSIVIRTDREGSRVLYQPATDTSLIDRICLSPNGQYLAVEVIPGGATSDRYPAEPGFAGSTVYFVDTDSGATRRGLSGMLPDWCG